MSAVNRGELTDKRFFSDLLPDYEYEQFVYAKNNYYAIECKSRTGKIMSNWTKFYETVKNRLGDKLKEVYSITSDGVHFIIYIDM